MNIGRIGEFGLIGLLAEDTIYDQNTVAVGIGDDAAALLPSPGKMQLATTDMLVETIHFNLNTATARQIGYKAVAVNLSDIAAMGGTPLHVLASIALPKKTKVEFVLQLYKGMKDICQEFQVNIVGGDTVASPGTIVINITAIGEVDPAHLTRRSGAKAGDVVAVTGMLGSSFAGLELLRTGLADSFPGGRLLTNLHLTPRPQIVLGQRLATVGATSMDDVSDGLASETHEIASASNAGIELYAEKIPILPETAAVAAHFGKSALDYALYGGEDFQLLFTMPPDIFKTLEKTGTANIYPVGKVVGGEASVLLIHADKTTEKIKPRGYNHFHE